MGHSLLCMMGFFLLSTVICGNAEDHSYDSQDADKSGNQSKEQTTSAQRDEFGVNSGNSNVKTDSTTEVKIKATLTADSTTTPAGGSVTLTCDVKDSADIEYELRKTSSENEIISLALRVQSLSLMEASTPAEEGEETQV